MTTLRDRFDVVVVGSGAGGGVVAGELAQRGRDVLLLEIGSHYRAADFMRWEAKAAHDLFWPLRFAPLPNGELVTFLAGRCVGGTTTINTKVAFRAHARDIAKWHPATGLTSDGSTPFAVSDIESYYDRVEKTLGVRERADWEKSVYTVEPGFRALGAELEAVNAYTDPNCTSCGSCIQGCASNAGKSTMNTYIADALARGTLELRANAAVERVLIDGAEATGVAYVDAAGGRHTVNAGAVVVAAGALNTPQLLIRSGLENAAVGRHLGLHPVRLVYGLFDEPQDAHMVYPISAHCVKHQHDDESGPLWGPRLVEAVRRFRYWIGFLAMANDDNNSSVSLGDDGMERLDVDLRPVEHERIEAGLHFSRAVLEAAGAKQVCWTGLVSTHVQGSCRMGDDPKRSVVDRNGESHDVKRLFVGDASLVPRTLSVNPSLTIMALATRLAEHLDADASGYLRSAA
jgi:choline dehydrogenase-like flavoprotein